MEARTFDNILIEIADKHLTKLKQVSVNKTDNKHEWMTQEILSSKKALKGLKIDFLDDHSNLNRRQRYLQEKRKLKSMMYHVKKAYVNNKQDQLSRLATESPRLFWVAVKKLQRETSHNKAKSIPSSVWKKHFQKLLNSLKSVRT